MKKIFLHIGTFKTGSTALQFHMHQNRKNLLRQGFYYGDYFDNYYLHSNLCYGLLKEALISYGIFEKYKDHPRFLNVAEEPSSVINRIKENSLNCSNIIISCEAFFADAFRTLVGLRNELSKKVKKDINRYMRERLKSLLFTISDDIVIVCYFRRQDLFIESQYNQYCKNTWYGDCNDKLPTFKEFVQYNPIELDYLSVLDEWRAIFDGANFVIKPYEEATFKHDLISDFYTEILMIDYVELKKFEGTIRERKNIRLDRDVLEYKIRLGINDVRLSQLIKEYSAQLGQIRDYARGKNAGAFDGYVKIAVVYRLYFHGKLYTAVFVFPSAEARHTEHRKLLEFQPKFVQILL